VYKSCRCGLYEQVNVLAAHWESAHRGALTALKDAYNAEDIGKAKVTVKALEVGDDAMYPKAVAMIVDDLNSLLEFCRYLAPHWIHLRAMSPFKSAFAKVLSRTNVKGPCSRAAGLAVAYGSWAPLRLAGGPSTPRTWSTLPSFTLANCSNDAPRSTHPNQKSPQMLNARKLTIPPDGQWWCHSYLDDRRTTHFAYPAQFRPAGRTWRSVRRRPPGCMFGLSKMWSAV
jgi:hypothetical protein